MSKMLWYASSKTAARVHWKVTKRFNSVEGRSGIHQIFKNFQDSSMVKEAKIIVGPYYRVFSDNKGKYDDQGFIVLPNLVSGIEIKHLRGEFDMLIDDPHDPDNLEDEFQEDDERIEFLQTFERTQILRPRDFFKPFRGFILETRAKSVANQLLWQHMRFETFGRGWDEVNQYHSSTQVKWRQDAIDLAPVEPGVIGDAVGITLFLDDCENFLGAVPGSHKEAELREHREVGGYEPTTQLSMADAEAVEWPDDIKSGSAFVYNLRLLKGIGQNPDRERTNKKPIRTITHVIRGDTAIANDNKKMPLLFKRS